MAHSVLCEKTQCNVMVQKNEQFVGFRYTQPNLTDWAFMGGIHDPELVWSFFIG